MCAVQLLRDRERAGYMMLMLGFTYTTDQLAMASSVCWGYDHVFGREDGPVLRWANRVLG